MEPYGGLFWRVVSGAFFKPKRGQACPFGAAELLISPKGAWQAPFGLDVGSGGLMRPFFGPKGAHQAPFGPKKGPGCLRGLFFGQKGAQEAPLCPKVGPGGAYRGDGSVE